MLRQYSKAKIWRGRSGQGSLPCSTPRQSRARNFSWESCTGVDFRHGPELGVRTEDEVDTGAGPLEFARGAITTLEHVFVFRGCLPRRSHVEQIHEEVIGERLWPLGEDAVPGLSEVGIQDAHTANENRHLRSGQLQQVRPINQQFLCRYGVFGFEVVAEPVRSRFEYGE